jgi:hypothetical protein
LSLIVAKPSSAKRIASPNVTTTRKKIATRLIVFLHNYYKPFETKVNMAGDSHFALYAALREYSAKVTVT